MGVTLRQNRWYGSNHANELKFDFYAPKNPTIDTPQDNIEAE